ncbi:MAG: hypothetical protein AB1426_07660 [Bacillota bacterium]
MSKLAKAFEVLEAAGCRFVPVPGTKWYEIGCNDGGVVLVKEKQIIEFFGDGDPEKVREWLLKHNLKPGSRYKESRDSNTST